MFPTQIFRAYDVRGIVGIELSEEFFETAGKAFGTMIKSKTKKLDCAVGRDIRSSSLSYQYAFVKGLLSTGCDVIDVGVLTTPGVYFSQQYLKTSACAAITASHNPPEFNGLKMRLLEKSVNGLELKPWMEKTFVEGKGKYSRKSVLDAYVEALSKGNKLERRVKVVLDCGNGTAGEAALKAFKSIGAEVIPLFCNPLPTFPNHHPDPTKVENYEWIRNAVRKEKADLGIMLDGDGDRVGAITRGGEVFWADKLLMIFARRVLKEKKGAVIVGDVKVSQSLVDDVVNRGGKALLVKTGYPNVEEAMEEKHSPLGGEMSGHFYFYNEMKWRSDAIYASCRLLKIISESNSSLQELVKGAPFYYSTPEYRLKVGGEGANELKKEIVREISSYFKKTHEVISVDGARVLYDEGWGLVRYANTEPMLSLRFESRTREGLKRIKEEFRDKLSEFKEVEELE